MYKNKKILLGYITLNSGHHRASLAIEEALKKLSPKVETLNINAFGYTNPVLEKIINKTYMTVIKRRPEVWDYLYDNPKVLKNVQGMRDAIHKLNSKKLKNLLEDFKPDACACTQAFPCGMIADYKKNLNLDLPLVGVLTDNAPHSYWIFKDVDFYITPSEKSKEKFIKNGVSPDKIKPFGIPINPRFAKKNDKREICKVLGLDPDIPIILIMGGSQGLGPVEKILNVLEYAEAPFQIIVVCGINSKLKQSLSRKSQRYKRRLCIFGLVDNVDEFMEVSDIVITKPGGLTVSEALSKDLPMIIVHPLPGQEMKNTEYLLEEGVAVKADDCEDIATLVQELSSNTAKLEEMRGAAKRLKRPNSAFDIAELLLNI
ncbi:MAG: glycosyltransferase [Candidatus Omnitrophota bacterium]